MRSKVTVGLPGGAKLRCFGPGSGFRAFTVRVILSVTALKKMPEPRAASGYTGWGGGVACSKRGYKLDWDHCIASESGADSPLPQVAKNICKCGSSTVLPKTL